MNAPVAPTAPIPPSPLLAMHARYEAAWEEYNNIDTAQLKLNDRNEAERCLKFRYSDALKANNAETDALRLAILYQVPTTWQEALVLQYHVHSTADPHSDLTDDEKNALEIGLDTLFDFMCDEVAHGEDDGIFHRAECIVSDRRRYRTGKVGA